MKNTYVVHMQETFEKPGFELCKTININNVIPVMHIIHDNIFLVNYLQTHDVTLC